MLQQYLPFTVLKPLNLCHFLLYELFRVATVLTVYGIETNCVICCSIKFFQLQQYLPFTVLKLRWLLDILLTGPALQQYLPFTVLKRSMPAAITTSLALQQYLPFTVLKRHRGLFNWLNLPVATVLTVYGIETRVFPYLINKLWMRVATVLTVYGIETAGESPHNTVNMCCNSTYRLRY